MMALWHIKVSDVRSLEGDSGRFTSFLNALLHATAAQHGVPDSKVHTTARTSHPDGGIDAVIGTAIGGDTTGWLDCPTAWQYKAQAHKNITKKKLQNEINKTYAKELIQKGYGYRFVICGGMPSKKKEEWSKILREESRKIFAGAQPPMVLTEDDLAQWANRFPSICIGYFRPSLRDTRFLAFEAWQSETRKVVKEFVVPVGLRPTLDALAAFGNLSAQVARPCLTVQGAAGVGKTRLVCEAMAKLAGASALVVYADEEDQAVGLAKQVAVDPQCAAIIIADECGVKSRVDIARVLEGHASRARAICIDNTAQRPSSAGEEIVVKRLPQRDMEAILELNFPGIPQGRRRTFAELSGGFLRLAVDFCQRVGSLPSDGTLGAIPSHFYDQYLESRLTPEQIQAIMAISLLPRVGFKGDVAEELDQLGEICGSKRQAILDAAASMKDAPGFVAFAGRYLYVTPQIIAVAAFQRAWQAHIHHDPERFLKLLNPGFVERFHRQVESCGTDDMKKAVSDFFGQWVSQMTQQDLADDGKVRRLIQLVELQPELHLPALKHLILDTPREKLKALHVATGFGRSPRRELVWFCERAMALPKHFDDAEEMLLHFALAESEAPNLANNATHIWRQIFWPVGSGTAAPFRDRAGILRTRLFSNDAEIAKLAAGALRGVFATLRGHGMRHAGPAMIMGKLPPEEWQPRSSTEMEDCWHLPVGLLVECSNSSNQELAQTAQDIAAKNLHNLIHGGFFDDLKTILAPARLPSYLLPDLLETVDSMLKPDSASPNMTPELLAEVRAWRSGLVPRDIRARLIAAVGQKTTNHYGEESDAPWNVELTALAHELLADRSLLRYSLKWLCSDEARSASVFGAALGKLDKDAQLVKPLMHAVSEYHSTGFAGGYLRGLLNVSPSHASTLNTLLDSLEEQSPRDAFELITTGGDLVHSFERVTKLVRDGRLGVEYLRAFDLGTHDGRGRSRKLTEDETLSVLELYAGLSSRDSERALDAGVHFLWSQTMPYSGRDPGEIFGNPAMAKFARTIFSASVKLGGYYWREAIVKMLPFDPTFVIKTCTCAVFEGNAVAAGEAEAALSAAAREHPDAVLGALTPYVREKKTKWKFRVLKYGGLVRNLSAASVTAWLNKVGVDGAKALARSLPAPFLNEQNQPVIPEVTLAVLRRFGNREEVFQGFSLGLHSFQTYSGDIAAQHMHEAEIAKAFLNHDTDVIRRWARHEIAYSKREAKQERQAQEEFGI